MDANEEKTPQDQPQTEESSEETTEATGDATQPDETAARVDPKMYFKELKDEYGENVDQLAERLKKGEQYDEFYPEFTRTKQRLADVEKMMDNQERSRDAQPGRPRTEQDQLLDQVAERVSNRIMPSVEDQRLEMEIERMRTKYGEKFTPEMEENVLRYAHDTGTGKLEDAYRLSNFDDLLSEAETRGRDRAIKELQKSGATSPEGSAPAGAGAGEPRFKPYSRKDKKKSMSEFWGDIQEKLKRKPE